MKIKDINLQNVLNLLKTFSYNEVINEHSTSVTVTLYDDDLNNSMYRLFNQYVGNMKVDDILIDFKEEKITTEELANVIKQLLSNKWKHLIKVWNAEYEPLWNVDGKEVHIITNKYGHVITSEKGSSTTSEQLADSESISEQLVDSSATDYVSPYDSNTFSPSAKAETNSGKIKATSNSGKVKVSGSGEDTDTHSGEDIATDVYTRQGNIGLTSSMHLINEELDLWSNISFFETWFETIANVIGVPIYEC